MAVILPLSSSAAFSLSIQPSNIIPGDPIMIQIQGAKKISQVKEIRFGGKKLKMFLYRGEPTAFSAVDFSAKAGTSTVSAKFTDGTSAMEQIVISPRENITAAAPAIPATLGGNTAAAQKAIVSNLAAENKILATLHTGTKAYWTKPFIFPVANPVVTDPYGYSRTTGEYSILHKGTDFHAPDGTNVLASNRGVVRLVRNFRDYGKTIVIDHGLGVMTFSMHLSKIYVTEGQLVGSGEIIGLSGHTGYAAAPHLHFSVRINNISIDPMVFLKFFQN